MKVAKWLMLVIKILLVASVYFLTPGMKNFVLRKWGNCKKAVLLTEKEKVKNQDSTLLYQFTINNNEYKGNSIIEDPEMAGDSVCVIYLKYFPGINRQSDAFKSEVNCYCN